MVKLVIPTTKPSIMPKKTLFKWLIRAALKICLFSCCLLASLQSFPQKTKFGVKAGVVFSNCNIEYTDTFYTSATKTKTSFVAGVFVYIHAGKNVSFRPGIELVRKGTNEKNKNSIYSSALQLNYLDFPLNALYEIKCKNENKILVGGGPVISYFLTNDQYYSLANIDIGANVMLGYEWPIGASINLNYTGGLKNASTAKTYISKLKNYYFGLSVGYWF